MKSRNTAIIFLFLMSVLVAQTTKKAQQKAKPNVTRISQPQKQEVGRTGPRLRLGQSIKTPPIIKKQAALVQAAPVIGKTLAPKDPVQASRVQAAPVIGKTLTPKDPVQASRVQVAPIIDKNLPPKEKRAPKEKSFKPTSAVKQMQEASRQPEAFKARKSALVPQVTQQRSQITPKPIQDAPLKHIDPVKPKITASARYATPHVRDTIKTGQTTFLQQHVAGRPWSYWWHTNPYYFLYFFPAYFYSIYGEYPPIYYEYYDATGIYPSDAFMHRDPIIKCTRDCLKECQQTTVLSDAQCLSDCTTDCYNQYEKYF